MVATATKASMRNRFAPVTFSMSMAAIEGRPRHAADESPMTSACAPLIMSSRRISGAFPEPFSLTCGHIRGPLRHMENVGATLQSPVVWAGGLSSAAEEAMGLWRRDARNESLPECPLASFSPPSIECRPCVRRREPQH
eukprot:6444896-Amphidinium_carterae.1